MSERDAHGWLTRTGLYRVEVEVWDPSNAASALREVARQLEERELAQDKVIRIAGSDVGRQLVQMRGLER